MVPFSTTTAHCDTTTVCRSQSIGEPVPTIHEKWKTFASIAAWPTFSDRCRPYRNRAPASVAKSAFPFADLFSVPCLYEIPVSSVMLSLPLDCRHYYNGDLFIQKWRLRCNWAVTLVAITFTLFWFEFAKIYITLEEMVKDRCWLAYAMRLRPIDDSLSRILSVCTCSYHAACWLLRAGAFKSGA